MVAASHLCGCHQKLQVAYCQGGHLARPAIGVMSHSIGEYSAMRLLQALPHHIEVLNVICLSWVDSHPTASDQPHQFWTEHLCAHPRCHRWPEGMRNQRVGLPRTGVGNEPSFRAGSGTGSEYYSRATSDVASF